MPRLPAAASDAPPPAPAPNFEAAMAELESLVQQMDSAQIPLESLLEKYARGKLLLGFCQSRLEEAQQRVDLISAQADGSVTSQPFAAAPPSSPTGKAPSHDDIRLA